jgi:transglutaminase-like putative cysteine protease
MLRIVADVTLLVCCWLCFVSHAIAQGEALNSRVIRDDTPARLVELTAHLKTTNQTGTPVRRCVYRVTKPAEDVASQRIALLSSDIPPAMNKVHKTGANEYLEFHFPVGPNATVENDVKFLVLIVPVDYTQVKQLRQARSEPAPSHEPYLQPSRLVESDSAEVQAAAKEVFASSRTPGAKAFAAYRYPSQVLKFKLQKEQLGAQKALQMKTGDCTEHACLFAALCRTQGIPARRMAVFNMGENEEIHVRQPNHDIAEVYVESHGWLPVDANLGRGRKDRPVGFAKLSNNFVIMNREGAWVYSTWLPPNGYDKSQPKPKMKYETSWDAKVIKEAEAKDLYREFAKRKKISTKRG